MGYQSGDTIAAIATPPGRGGIGVIRVSGPLALIVAQQLTGRQQIQPRHAYFSTFMAADQQAIDSGILLYFQAPHSFTGEDVIELQGHGGPVIMSTLLQRTLALGARAARAGEFSERAFCNGKLDLAQAEAIAALIEAQTEAQARAAQRSMEGVFSRQVNDLHQQLLALRAYVEAMIDFPEEDIEFLRQGDVLERMASLRHNIHQLTRQARQGALLREGARVVIAGQPNAGKSSLLNALAGHDAAIVTDVPGTTRDLLRECINLDGLPLQFIDTAGIRSDGDAVEQIGIARAWQAAAQADLLLLVVDAQSGFQAADQAILTRLGALPAIVIMNKCDLLGQAASQQAQGLFLSARHGQGLDLLRQAIRARLGQAVGETAPVEYASLFSANTRQLDALQRTLAALADASDAIHAQAGTELAAESLRQAATALGEITGQVDAELLLGQIFSTFCIGK